MARLVIHGGRVIDPAARLNRRMEVIIEGGRIAAVCAPHSNQARPRRGDRRITASGLLVLPGLIDLHVHLREPGMIEAEDVGSGTQAAAAGGFTTVVCMPNTNPVLDDPECLGGLLETVRAKAAVRVLPAAALSVGLKGRRLTPIEDLAAAGAAALSDDGSGTSRPKVLGQAIGRAAQCRIPVLVHCEDRQISRGGVMTAGSTARRLGLRGIPAAAETEATRRALGQAKAGGGRLHIQHVSTRGALAVVRRAKRAGLPVTCEVTPHHLFLSSGAVACTANGPDPNLKMNPPLRSERDRQALLEGLADGTVDAIASDHAPHTDSAKARGFIDAPFGVTGLETTLPLVLRLVEEGVISLDRAIALLTSGPARVMGLACGSLGTGAAADVTIVDPRAQWRVVPSRMKSRSRNTAFAGWNMRGRASFTIVGGRIVHGGGKVHGTGAD